MKILVTAGSTEIPIDKVRAISNIFKGRTGTDIARYCARYGNDVTLLTSNVFLLQNQRRGIRVIGYKTFDDLAKLMENEIKHGNYDVVIHSAAVSDFKVASVNTIDENGKLHPVDKSAKISSDHDRLFMELVPTPKLIDKIRTKWGFSGILVKFKLQVGISDEELLEIAKKSRTDSKADLIVANCLEWSRERAFILGSSNNMNWHREVPRHSLSHDLWEAIKCIFFSASPAQ